MNDFNNAYSAINEEMDPQIEAAIRSIRSESLSSAAIQRVKSKASAIEAPMETVIVANSLSNAWTQRWAKLGALAAGLLLTFGLFMLMPSQDVFAQVIEEIKKITTVRFTIESLGMNHFVAVASCKSPDHMRLDFQSPSNPVNITNGAAGELIAFDDESNQVSVNEIPKAKSEFDILQLLRAPDVRAVISSKENEIAGTKQFEIFNGQGRVWIDNETKLPKRMEMTPPAGSGASKLVYRDFEWNVPLDDGLFAMPVGRKIVRSSLLAKPKESELIAAFSLRQAFSEAPYEASFFDDSTEPGLRLGRLAYDLSKGREENYQIQSAKLNDRWSVLGISPSEAVDPSLVQKRIDYLCMKLDQWAHDIERTGAWVGTGVRPGESKPLCWWKDGKRIRVLNADLTIVDADQPPKVP